MAAPDGKTQMIGVHQALPWKAVDKEEWKIPENCWLEGWQEGGYDKGWDMA